MTAGGEGSHATTTSRPEPRQHGRAERRLWWTVGALLVLATTAWGLAVPLMSGPDEADQATRAAAVARGHLFGTRPPPRHQVEYYTIRVMAPVAYVSAHDVGFCWTLKGDARRTVIDPSLLAVPDRCPEMTGGQREESIPTNEFRGQPLYYFLVGLPTLVAPAATGAHLMRLVGGLLCAGFLASGLVSLTRLRSQRLAVLAAAVGLTPSVLYFAATVNPVGLEIAAAFSAWAGILALVRADRVDGRLVARTGLALATLVLTRGLSPGFAVLVVAVGLLAARPGRVRALLQRRDVRGWLAGTALAAVASGAWLLHIRSRFPLPPFAGSGLDFALDQLGWWAREMVGVFGPTTVVPPVAVHLLWLAAGVALVALAWRGGETRARALAGLLAVATFGLLVSGEGFSVPPTGVWWQGRYVLPALLGAVLLVALRAPDAAAGADPVAGAGRDPHPDPDPDLGRVATAMAGRALARGGPVVLGLLVAVQVWCLAYALRHYTVGPGGTANPLEFLTGGDWAPPLLPAWAYVAVLAGSLGLLSAVLWRTASRWDGSAGPASDQPGTVRRSDPTVTPAVTVT